MLATNSSSYKIVNMSLLFQQKFRRVPHTWEKTPSVAKWGLFISRRKFLFIFEAGKIFLYQIDGIKVLWYSDDGSNRLFPEAQGLLQGRITHGSAVDTWTGARPVKRMQVHIYGVLLYMTLLILFP